MMDDGKRAGDRDSDTPDAEENSRSRVLKELLRDLDLLSIDNNAREREGRCRLPKDILKPVHPTISSFLQLYENDVSFLRAIVELKTAITRMKEVPTEELRLIFHDHWRGNKDKWRKPNSVSNSELIDRTNAMTDNQTRSFRCTEDEGARSSETEEISLVPGRSSQSPQRYCNPLRRDDRQSGRIISDSDEEWPESPDMFEDASFETAEGDENMHEIRDNNDKAESMDDSARRALFRECSTVDDGPTKVSTSSKGNAMLESGWDISRIIADSEDENSLTADNDMFTEQISDERAYNPYWNKDILDWLTPCTQYNELRSIIGKDMFKINSGGSPGCNNSQKQMEREINPCMEYDSAYDTLHLRPITQDTLSKWQVCCTKNRDVRKEAQIDEARRKKRKIPVTDDCPLAKQVKRSQRAFSSSWLRFTLESMDVDGAVFESLRAILSAFENGRIPKQYMKNRCWKDTLEEEAADAIVSYCKIFQAEKKSRICNIEITRMIIRALERILGNFRQNEISFSTYHIAILSELSYCVEICTETIDYLIARLKARAGMTNTILDEGNSSIHVIVNELHILFYALDIYIWKFRTLYVPPRSDVFDVPPVTDLWKRDWYDRDKGIDEMEVKAKKREWANALEAFSMISKENFIRFAESSRCFFCLLTRDKNN
ncbi:hypothetical protein KM043_003287 [Ampulex compressa]|nr:hypothetical protein KM043_003287 [Ampulex compressa]